MNKKLWLLALTLPLSLLANIEEQAPEKTFDMVSLEKQLEATKLKINELEKLIQLEIHSRDYEEAQLGQEMKVALEKKAEQAEEFQKQTLATLQTREQEILRLQKQIEALKVSLQQKEKTYLDVRIEQEQSKQQIANTQKEQKETLAKVMQLEQQFSYMTASERKRQEEENSYRLPMRHEAFYAEADFLFWKPSLPDNDYAFYQTTPANVTYTDITGLLGDLKNTEFKWRPGARGIVGFYFPETLWRLAADYTFFYSRSSHSLTGTGTIFNPNDVPIINPSFQTGIEVATSMNAQAKLFYNVADLLLSKDICLGKDLWINFSGGAAAAFIHQRMSSHIEDERTITADHHWKWGFNGGGIKLGLDSHWNFAGGFSFLVGSYWSSLYGSHKNSYVSTVSTPNYTANNMTDHQKSVINSLQMLGGFSWNWAFNGMNLELSARYELNTWFEINRRYFSNIYNSTAVDKKPSYKMSSLTLQGVTIGAGFAF